MHLSLPKQFPLFILASSICCSLQCLISVLTQGGKGGHLFRLTCSVLLWGQRDTANKFHWHVWGVLAVSQPHWVCPCSWCMHFPLYTSQALGCSAREQSEAGPGLCALLRSKPLKFRFSGSPQRGRLCWACVFCPSQVQASQATRCLANAVSPGGEFVLSPPWSQPLSFLGGSMCVRLQCALCLFWGADLWLRPSRQKSTIQNPKGFWLATGCLLAAW